MMRLRLRAGFTVEAAFVMFTVFTVLAVIISSCLSLHDRVLARSIITESVEIFSHAGEDRALAAESCGKKIENTVSGAYSIIFSGTDGKGKMKALATDGKYSTERENTHLRPEKAMRALTLIKIIKPEGDR